MECLVYPFDNKFLKRKKAWIRETLLSGKKQWIHIKIAVLGGSTTNEIIDQMELFLLNHGIRAQFYQSKYGKYYEDAVFGNDELDSFSPDLVFIHTNWRNISRFPSLNDSDEAVQEILSAECSRFRNVWMAVHDRFECPVIQNNFDRPDYRLLGSRDIWDVRGRSHFIFRLNQFMYEFARGHDDFYVNDIDYVAASVGMDKWNSPVCWHMYKYICDLDAVPCLAASAANIIKSIYGRNKKLLAVDLDNTVWGGTVGEDGADGLVLGNDTPKGGIFSDIQSYLKELKETGVLLAVDSKNDYQNAVAGFHHPDSLLREDDFAAVEANWNPKDDNLVKIADNLSLGTDSFVFMDDNPAERDIVLKNIPGAAVPELSRPEEFIRLIDRGGYFETTVLSEDDRKKTGQYRARALAKKAEASYADYGDYLESLGMHAEIRDFEDVYIQRIVQLTNKSNQFNLTALRCTENGIRAMSESRDYICLYGRLRDKFGDNGIVAVSVGEKTGREVHIRLWLMSCRVLKRGMEDAMMNVFVERVKAAGCDKVIGYYFPTARNAIVKDMYAGFGFELAESGEDGSTVWELKTDRYSVKKTHIRLHTGITV